MTNQTNDPANRSNYIDVVRASVAARSKLRIRTQDEIVEWARELGREAARTPQEPESTADKDSNKIG